MEQEKIGRFLSELRKEQGLTQQQLADSIGVSNKTISKWECGKGMPEISSIMPLCQMLHINVNELISGERLSEDGYSKKAEENMMNLIQETEISKKKSRNSRSILLVAVISLLLGVGLTIITNFGISNGVMFLDMPSLLPMLIVALLFLMGTGLGRPFLHAFTIVTGKKKEVSESEILQAKAAMKLVSNALLGMGIFESCVGFMAVMPINIDDSLWAKSLFISIPIALLGVFYGLIGFLLLLPIRMKLESIAGCEIPLDKKPHYRL